MTALTNPSYLEKETEDFSWAAQTDTMFWDMDLVLYEPHAQFIRTCWKSSYRTAMEFIPGLKPREAIALCHQSWKNYHSGYDFLVKERGVNQEAVLTAWHENLDESFMIPAHQNFIEKMHKAAQTHVLITHGSRSWSKRVLAQRNLQDVFLDKNIFSFEDIFPNKKNISSLP